ncbi:MAG: bifunctional methylenetetrahydrofolate dehydrogenase/methenyltetrahydrofolate cyclohydrolase FolD [Alphaproteobacteria bacterium]|nr:bifunctional methylenetetrahydrofolate dehydrogenase/methenyltetrahydrofolate cyclohydrolase FolD [Alphaproteobacteria bacterium]
MSEARILDGKALAASVRVKLAGQVVELKAKHGISPGIAVLLVGEDPASQVYVRAKGKAAAEVGFHAVERRLPATAREREVLQVVDDFNNDPKIHGFLVQLPLPKQVDPQRVIDAIDPSKDADGFHVVNAGLGAQGRGGVAPATPRGVLELIKLARSDLGGLEAVVIGRSISVGRPTAQLLIGENCTVTIAHSRTRKLADVARRADILVAAVGRAEMVRGDWIKPGAIVIDVGITRGADNKLVGDVAFDEAKQIAGAITPVPGGVGPMTIACLLQNTFALCKNLHGIVG